MLVYVRPPSKVKACNRVSTGSQSQPNPAILRVQPKPAKLYPSRPKIKNHPHIFSMFFFNAVLDFLSEYFLQLIL